MSELKLFCMSALLQQQFPDRVVSKLMLGYRMANNLDEAKGKYVSHLQEEFPDRSIVDLLCLEIPVGEINDQN